MSDLKNNNTN